MPLAPFTSTSDTTCVPTGRIGGRLGGLVAVTPLYVTDHTHFGERRGATELYRICADAWDSAGND